MFAARLSQYGGLSLQEYVQGFVQYVLLSSYLLCVRRFTGELGVVGALLRSGLVGGGCVAISTGDTMKVTRQKDLIAPLLVFDLG